MGMFWSNFKFPSERIHPKRGPSQTLLTAFRLFQIWISTESHSNPCFDGPQYCVRTHFCPCIVESVTQNMHLPISTRLDLMIFFRSIGKIIRCMHQRHVLHPSFVLYQFLRAFLFERITFMLLY